MNSKERHELRYQRRKAKREQRKQELAVRYGDYKKVFTFEHLYKAYKASCRGVGWKASTQRYKANALLNVVETLDSLLADKFKTKGFYEFDIVERGKPRHIKSVHISERVVQRCLCDNSLVPTFSRSFIYDNGACMKDKGIDFAADRFSNHLRSYYRENGTNEGYALTFDFLKYFDTIDHEKLKVIIAKCYADERLRTFICKLVDDFGGNAGLGLGSQISQVSALMYPNVLDHYVKEVLKIKHYGRYMDDGYLVHREKEYLKLCLVCIREICDTLGIKLNEKKTQIVKLSNGVTFLKRRFILTPKGKVIRIPARKGIAKHRQKLKKFKRRLDEGKMSLEDIRTSHVSFIGHIKHCNAYRTKRSLDKRYYQLFIKGADTINERSEDNH